ncbi:septation protein SepH [Microlunatus capsulatus]|uniref:DUF3071 domain-containing protein n=1 Tax=Microlunatus capsulatus TaxID=99117 RepID=A0ABS4ZFD3_9ACTN|nr:septation protein SepH [Microlunatus capsulatus]MBP2418948.1 hypothetical protein [Microlunatus capsulatus]
MRSAHLVGPSPDGRSLVLTTDDGDELAVVVDDRLRDAVRGTTGTTTATTTTAGTAGGGTARAARPRPGRGENAMDTSLSPRDIQMRVRAGESLEDVAEVAGIPYERVERFAAPVLAEREHLALMALAASVRRRGETSGHRTLRATVAERLLKRGVDADAVVWDSHRLEDGRWAVTAGYALDGEEHHATFTFDQRGRYSVAADDEARRLIGEQPPVAPGTRRRSDAADEPTVDLSDELALVRATQEAADARAAARPATPPAGDALPPEDEDDGDDGVLPGALVTEAVLTEVVVEQTEISTYRTLRAVPFEDDDTALPPEPVRGPAEELLLPEEPDEEAPVEDSVDEQPVDEQPAGEPPAVPGVEDPSELTTLYAMLGSDGYSEDSPRVYAGLSDASAVPETAGGHWEPAIVVDYPVEPSPANEAELPAAEHPDRSRVPMDDKAAVELSTPVDPGPPPADRLPGTDEPAPPYARTDEADRAEEAEEFQLESEPPPEKKPKRKRAAVPSWDEIMFGGPKPGS